LISPAEREKTVALIQTALKEGARLVPSCETVGISLRTYQRWKAGNYDDRRKGAAKHVPRKLTDEERREIRTLCCNDEFKDANPYEIVITLLERRNYLASISSFYRVLKAANLLNHRSNKRPGRKQTNPPEVIANGPNQVWCWDITWLPTAVKGIFLYAYVIIDVWDKSIVDWVIHDTESEQHAKRLFERALAEQGYPKVHIHSDNGNPMKGISLLSLLYDLKCKNSFSRPRVSNDNPYIESFFGTMKCSVKYPGRFAGISEARIWMAEFVDWYNTSHRHSGIYFFTPRQMRTGEYKKHVEIRNQTMNEAMARKPERWSRPVKQWSQSHTVYLNPSLETRQKKECAA
jgi:putative transposase